MPLIILNAVIQGVGFACVLRDQIVLRSYRIAVTVDEIVVFFLVGKSGIVTVFVGVLNVVLRIKTVARHPFLDLRPIYDSPRQHEGKRGDNENTEYDC